MKKIFLLSLFSLFFITLAGFAKTDYIFIGSEDSTLYKVDGYDNTIWEYTEHTDIINAVYVDNNNFIYSASDDNSVHKIDSDGNNVWKYNHSNFVYSVYVDENGNVYFGSKSKDFVKLDSDGNLIWTASEPTGNARGIIVDENNNVYGVSDDGNIRKYDSNGDLIWSNTDMTFPNNIDYDNGFIYVGSIFGDNDIHKIEIENGTTIWSYQEHNFPVNDVFVKDNFIYSASNDNSVHKIDLEGNNVWKYTYNEDFKSLFVNDSNFVYAGTNNNELHKISSTGNRIWIQEVGTGNISGIFVVRDYRYDETTTGLLYLLPTIYTITIISGGFVFAVVRKNENRMKSIIETAIFIVLGLSLLPIIIAIGQW
jgi:hypothetical protein